MGFVRDLPLAIRIPSEPNGSAPHGMLLGGPSCNHLSGGLCNRETRIEPGRVGMWPCTACGGAVFGVFRAMVYTLAAWKREEYALEGGRTSKTVSGRGVQLLMVKRCHDGRGLERVLMGDGAVLVSARLEGNA